MAADFIPEMKGYSGQGAFRFWCQTVLPLVYDDSLSYYELLNKVVHYLNNTISDVRNVEDNVDSLYNAFVQLQEWVNTYFDNLDLQEYIDTTLDEMAADGTLTDIVAPFIPDIVTAWLDEHIVPTAPIIDKTLTIEDAAADAKETGKLLFGGTNHTGKSPKVMNFYSVNEGETIDIKTMPYETKIYKYASYIDGLPSDIDSDSAIPIFVMKTNMTLPNALSLIIVFDQNTQTLYYGTYVEGASIIAYNAVPLRGEFVKQFHSVPQQGLSMDDYMDTGIYETYLDSENQKHIRDFPFRTGILAVFAIQPLVERNGEETLYFKRCFQLCFNSGNNYGWRNSNPTAETVNTIEGEFSIPLMRFYNGHNWSELKNFCSLNSTAIANLNIDEDGNDWLLTDFEDIRGWWTTSGALVPDSSATPPVPLYHTEFIPVHPGQKLYSMYFGGQGAAQSAGAFFNENKQWRGTLIFPYVSGGVQHDGLHVVEYPYYARNVAPNNGLLYAKLYEITVPDGARYLSLNVRRSSAVYKDVQTISTLPIIGASYSGNYIWRRNDPIRQVKKGKKLAIIAESCAAVDRAFRTVYDAATQTSSNVDQPIVGFQEYLMPYYGEGNIFNFGFSGIGYRWESSWESDWQSSSSDTKSIYHYITGSGDSANYTYKTEGAAFLSQADEVLIIVGSNNTGDATQDISTRLNYIGDYRTSDVSTHMGAINQLINYLYQQSEKKHLTIYISTVQNKYINTTNTSSKPIYDTLNYQTRMLANERGLVLIDWERLSGFNANNFMYMTYDSDVFPPYGTHFNNYGQKIRGEILLNGLVSTPSTFDKPGTHSITPYSAFVSNFSLLKMGNNECAYGPKYGMVEFGTGGAFSDCPITWSGYAYVTKQVFLPGSAGETTNQAALFTFYTANLVFQCWRAGSPRSNTWLTIASNT